MIRLLLALLLSVPASAQVRVVPPLGAAFAPAPAASPPSPRSTSPPPSRR
ncbi:MAG: hypothetical protein M0D55_03815 [Elusimicrobiota bacterium]|nr:MAG: hypothetical protein M0D55_03815 [Elusimicrobiota bacterium]